MTPKRINLLQTPVDQINLKQTVALIGEFLKSDKTNQIVTTNPEAVVRAQTDEVLRKALWAAELVTADGEGIVWAVNQGKDKLDGRVPGSDLVPALFKEFGSNIHVYFLGAKPGIAEKAASESASKWGIQIAGFQDGYFKDSEAVIERIKNSGADLLLVGMGERQDTFIYENKEKLGAKVAIGIGGMLDVLSGEVKRVHPLAQKLKIEWLLRVGLDPKRWGRFPRLIKFVTLVLRNKNG